MSYQSMEEAYERCERDSLEFWKAVQLEDAHERGVSDAIFQVLQCAFLTFHVF